MIRNPDPNQPFFKHPHDALQGGVPIVVDQGQVAVLMGPQGPLGVLGPGQHVVGPQGTPQLGPMVDASGWARGVELYIVRQDLPMIKPSLQQAVNGGTLDVAVEMELSVADPGTFVTQCVKPQGAKPAAIEEQIRGYLWSQLMQAAQGAAASANTGPMGMMNMSAAVLGAMRNVDLRWCGLSIRACDNVHVGVAGAGSAASEPGPEPEEEGYVRMESRVGGVGVSLGTDGFNFDQEAAVDKVKSEVQWKLIGCGIGLLVMFLLCGLGGYIAWQVRDATSGNTTSTSSSSGAVRTESWDGTRRYSCASGNRRIENVNATAPVSAIGRCHLTLVNVNITAGPTAVSAIGNAQVTIQGGSVTGTPTAIRAMGGQARVNVQGAQVTGARRAVGGAQITGL